MNETRVYRLPLFTRLIFLSGTLFFSALAFWSVSDNAEVVAISCFVPFALVCFVSFLLSLYTIRVTDTEIVVTSLFRKRDIAWHEVADVQFKESGFVLLNNGADKKVTISSQVVGFIDVVRLVSNKISPIWNTKTLTEFHTSWLTLTWFVGMGLFGVFMIYLGTQGVINNDEDFSINVSVILIGALFFGMSFLAPIRDAFEDDYLVIIF